MDTTRFLTSSSQRINGCNFCQEYRQGWIAKSVELVATLAHQGYSGGWNSQFWSIDTSQKLLGYTSIVDGRGQKLVAVEKGLCLWRLPTVRPSSFDIFQLEGFLVSNLASLYQESLIVMSSFATAAHALQSQGILCRTSLGDLRFGETIKIVTRIHVGNVRSSREEPEGGKFVLCLPSFRVP